MKIWTNNEFAGHWPVGTAAVVIAETPEDAAVYLNSLLKEEGLECEAGEFKELPFIDGQVAVLCNGEY